MLLATATPVEDWDVQLQPAGVDDVRDYYYRLAGCRCASARRRNVGREDRRT